MPQAPSPPWVLPLRPPKESMHERRTAAPKALGLAGRGVARRDASSCRPCPRRRAWSRGTRPPRGGGAQRKGVGMSFVLWQRGRDTGIASTRLVLRAAEVPLLAEAHVLRDRLEALHVEQ